MASHPKVASPEPRQLISGNYSDTCWDCGTTVIGTLDEVLAARCNCDHGRTTRQVVERICLQCGRDIAPGEPRCGVCGGQPIVDDVTTTLVYPDLPPLQFGPHRGGRPRKVR